MALAKYAEDNTEIMLERQRYCSWSNHSGSTWKSVDKNEQAVSWKKEKEERPR